MNSIDTLLLIGAAQGLFLALFLFGHKRGNQIANKTLSLVVFLFALSIIMHTMEHSGIYPEFPNHEMAIEVLMTLINPLLYFYTKAMTEKEFCYDKTKLVHAIPFITGLLLFVIWSILDSIQNLEPVAHVFISVVVSFQVLFYIYLIIKKLRLHAKNIRSTHSSLERINLKWLLVLIIVYASFWIIALFAEVLMQQYESWDYGWLMVSICLYLIGYMAMKQPEIFTGEIVESKDDTKKTAKKYEKSTLDEETATYYLEKLERVMKSEKPYLKSSITLPALADVLSVSQHHLSQIINEKYDMNFFQFINKYRIEEAQQLMKDPAKSHLKIAAISYEAGFSSLSTFNSAFKKMTGQTPSEFKSRIE